MEKNLYLKDSLLNIEKDKNKKQLVLEKALYFFLEEKDSAAVTLLKNTEIERYILEKSDSFAQNKKYKTEKTKKLYENNNELQEKISQKEKQILLWQHIFQSELSENQSLQSLFKATQAHNKTLENIIDSLQNELLTIQESHKKIEFINDKGDKVLYYGEVKNETAQGFGMGLVEGKGIYVGEWANNLRHGKGKYIWENKHVYEGDFVRGKRQGFGTYTFDTGQKYVGGWSEDLREGEGALYDEKNKLLVSGIWKKDKLISKN
ncbi:hypothetical protein [Hugenholtzia roseola]|uniref:hypothetical protein n=1 Tax=Hugenholtzia roseola TaxID=1002 RepID=UPI001B7FE2DC|nr:hypothetical protein [Hugenholtzia roseola]